MITLRQIQRLWDERRFNRLIACLLEARVESSPRLAARLSGATAAAALAVIRLEELDQSHAPLAGSLVRCILASRANDGGWDDPMLCALCLRALMTSRGQGPAIQQASNYLANLQKTEGIWPAGPLRRMPSDTFVSAFILLQLGASREFGQSIRVDEAIRWFEANAASLDGETAKLWHHASIRLSVKRIANAEPVLWS